MKYLTLRGTMQDSFFVLDENQLHKLIILLSSEGDCHWFVFCVCMRWASLTAAAAVIIITIFVFAVHENYTITFNHALK